MVPGRLESFEGKRTESAGCPWYECKMSGRHIFAECDLDTMENDVLIEATTKTHEHARPSQRPGKRVTTIAEYLVKTEAKGGNVNIVNYEGRGQNQKEAESFVVILQGVPTILGTCCSGSRHQTNENALPLHRGVVDDTGASTAVFFVALVGIALVVADLVRVVDESKTDTASTWKKRLTSCRDRIANAVPLTSIKIVLVAWQIVTQVSEGQAGPRTAHLMGRTAVSASDTFHRGRFVPHVLRPSMIP